MSLEAPDQILNKASKDLQYYQHKLDYIDQLKDPGRYFYIDAP